MVKLPLTIEHALLGFVRQGAAHGYDIYQRLLASEELGLVWSLKQSQVYALLAKLEEEGYLASDTAAQGSRPPRKLLRLTEAGQTALERWIGTPVQHGRDFRLEFLAKLYFACDVGRPTAAHLIAAQRAACQGWLAELRSQLTQLATDNSYDWLVLHFRIGQLEATLVWLASCDAWLERAVVRNERLEI
ncbi:MAG: PadR family transcriptional regulator [Chloroflexaceae bacterium]|jgi:DNA-binding PadR family transcriptional regulator|nr:PadR family transcriptional regulator [Chloroflexaceae bacterium]